MKSGLNSGLIQEEDLKSKAVENFKSGYSCSEAVVKAAVDSGIASLILLKSSTIFSGGMSSGCLCGAVAGAQLVLGENYGTCGVAQEDVNKNLPKNSRQVAKEFLEEFKAKHKVSCCKALSAGFDFHSPERKKNCEKYVADCAQILGGLLNELIESQEA